MHKKEKTDLRSLCARARLFQKKMAKGLDSKEHLCYHTFNN